MIQPGGEARERYGELREVVGYGIGGMGNTQNDLFIRSGICTGHELKNDGHLDKFPFVRFYYPHQMQIYDRTRKFTPRPVRESIFFVVFFGSLSSHIRRIDVRCFKRCRISSQ